MLVSTIYITIEMPKWHKAAAIFVRSMNPKIFANNQINP